MDSAADVLGPTQARLSLTVPWPEQPLELRDAWTGSAELAGFRAGRLPLLSAVRDGGAAAPTRPVEAALLALVATAAGEHQLRALGRVDVDIVGGGVGEPLRLAAVVDLRPDIAVPDPASVVLAVDPVTVSEDAIQQHLDWIREGLADLDDVDRPAAAGDVVQAEIHTSVDGQDVPEATSRNVWYEVGSGYPVSGLDPDVVGLTPLPAGLNATLPGLVPGGSARFVTSLVGGGHAGHDATVTVTVTAVKQRRIPPLNDELAVRAGNFTAVDELRAAVTDGLRRAGTARRVQDVRDEVLRQLTAATAVPVPAGLLADEIAHRREWMRAELHRLGTSLSDHAATTHRTPEQIDDDLAKATEQRIRSQLLLDAVADREDIQVSEVEVGEAISHRADRVGALPQSYLADLIQAGAGPAVNTDVRRSKALARILQRVRLTDRDGNPLHLIGT
jgi:trigger factor